MKGLVIAWAVARMLAALPLLLLSWGLLLVGRPTVKLGRAVYRAACRIGGVDP